MLERPIIKVFALEKLTKVQKYIEINRKIYLFYVIYIISKYYFIHVNTVITFS